MFRRSDPIGFSCMQFCGNQLKRKGVIYVWRSSFSKKSVQKLTTYKELLGAKCKPYYVECKSPLRIWSHVLRVTCCNGHLYLCKIEKNRFSENLSGRRFLLTCFKTVTLRLFGFLFSSPDGLLYFARKRAKLGPEIALFAKAGKPKYCAWLEKLTHIIKI